jgi:hypothetical protein
MSFKAELQLEGNTYLIRALSLDISQTIDKVGRPSSSTKGGNIEIQLDVVQDDIFADWIVDPKKKLNGTITYYNIDQASKMKEVKFEDAFCVEFSEIFDGTMSESSMMTHVKISAEKLSIGNVELSNNWPK